METRVLSSLIRGQILKHFSINLKIYFHNIGKTILIDLVIIILLGIINPFFNHEGKTILFKLINDYSLEALIYGVFSGFMITAVINYCSILTLLIDSSKFNYLFGRVLPKSSLVLSITYNFIPRMTREYKVIDENLKALGYYSTKSRKNMIRNKLKAYSMLITWSLENSIETSDSMVSRGFTVRKRTKFKEYKFNFMDILFICSLLFVSVFSIIFLFNMKEFNYFPNIEKISLNKKDILAILSITLLNGLLLIFEGGERLRWHYLKSRI